MRKEFASLVSACRYSKAQNFHSPHVSTIHHANKFNQYFNMLFWFSKKDERGAHGHSSYLIPIFVKSRQIQCTLYWTSINSTSIFATIYHLTVIYKPINTWPTSRWIINRHPIKILLPCLNIRYPIKEGSLSDKANVACVSYLDKKSKERVMKCICRESVSWLVLCYTINLTDLGWEITVEFVCSRLIGSLRIRWRQCGINIRHLRKSESTLKICKTTTVDDC